MKRYAKYKDSGISWIGDVPEHWEVSPFRSQFSLGKGLPITKDDLIEDSESGIPVISYGQIHSKDNDGLMLKKEMLRYVSSDFLISNPQSLLFENDIIFADTSEDICGCGNCVLNTVRGNVFAGYHTIIARIIHKTSGRYLAFLLQSDLWRSQIRTRVNGVKVFSVTRSHLRRCKLFIPPLSEQKAIADFLDKKTAQINELVAAKKKQIELLKEYKQAVIAKAVTQGINPKAKMKDSGITWIGQIPEHWNIKRAKYMFVKEKREVRDSDEVITCFRDGEVTLRKNRRTTGFTESLTEVGYQGIRKNDLVIHQMDAFAGAIGVSDSDGKGTSVYHCCTPMGDYNVFYYSNLLRTMAKKGFIQSLYRGIRERSSDFNFQIFSKQYLVIPPLPEQEQIVAYIKEKVDSIDAQIASVEKQIANLNEFKQSLISDAVTGKIKVA